jgi:hypothetical protein
MGYNNQELKFQGTIFYVPETFGSLFVYFYLLIVLPRKSQVSNLTKI